MRLQNPKYASRLTMYRHNEHNMEAFSGGSPLPLGWMSLGEAYFHEDLATRRWPPASSCVNHSNSASWLFRLLRTSRASPFCACSVANKLSINGVLRDKHRLAF
ncbi:predicted protein [Histoplasma capsulatum var. duboisii H88]|uniref:Predicted protein n=1 Tax=Ajellomyces capsulatus (strain H88) TaxID=544711 RepID=F0UP44_AJEC8|nr:predicted protein [Histoplasma capsulatum var. duboisii H88]